MPINEEYLQASSLKEKASSEGFELVWMNADKVQARLLVGYKYAYEYRLNWWRCKLVNASGQLLLKKPKAESRE